MEAVPAGSTAQKPIIGYKNQLGIGDVFFETVEQ